VPRTPRLLLLQAHEAQVVPGGVEVGGPQALLQGLKRLRTRMGWLGVWAPRLTHTYTQCVGMCADPYSVRAAATSRPARSPALLLSFCVFVFCVLRGGPTLRPPLTPPPLPSIPRTSCATPLASCALGQRAHACSTSSSAPSLIFGRRSSSSAGTAAWRGGSGQTLWSGMRTTSACARLHVHVYMDPTPSMGEVNSTCTPPCCCCCANPPFKCLPLRSLGLTGAEHFS